MRTRSSTPICSVRSSTASTASGRPRRHALLPVDARGELGAPSALIADAHAAGLSVVAYTFRPENPFLPPALRQGGANARNPEGSVAEIRAYVQAGIDAFFTDDPALGRRAVDGDAVVQGGMP